jgi:glycosyltransferase involved in cell wall biosynthesis
MRLSVLIRNYNEASELELTLNSLRRQKTSFQFETIVLDNESTDHSVAVCESFGCKVHTISRSEFTYGSSLNVGIDHCKGSVILLLSAHIVLLNEYFIEQIAEVFASPKVAFVKPVSMTKSQQVSQSLSGIRQLELDLTQPVASRLAYLQQHWSLLLIANCSAISRDVALKIRFNESIEASEDKLWSKLVLEAGYIGLYNLPCYFYYSKRTTVHKRLQINYNETKTKAEILGQPYYNGSKIGFVLASLGYALRTHCPTIMSETRLAWRLVKLGKRTKSY